MEKRLMAVLFAVLLVLSLFTGVLADEQNVAAELVKLRPAIGADNLLANGDMETIGEDGFPVKVDAHGGWNVNKVTLETQEVHSGNYAAKIETSDGGSPWVRVQAFDLMGGGTYQLSFWYKGEIRSEGTGFNIKFEGYTDNSMRTDNDVIQTDLYEFRDADEWTQVVYTVTIPDNCKMIAFYPRCYPTDGTLYVDDLKFYLVDVPAYFDFDTDQIFYYSDLETGVATVSIKEYAENIGYTADFAILDGETELFKVEGVKFNKLGKAQCLFPLSVLTEKNKEYTLRMDAKNPDGTVAEFYEQDIYKYDRPTMLTQEGNFIVDGQPFYPALLYHSRDVSTMKKAVEQGITVVQTPTEPTVEATLARFDEIGAQGMKVALILYGNGKAAGAPEAREWLINMVNGVKDHPAFFCWMTMDEPHAHYNNRQELYDVMTAGYKTIRDIDPVHPIYHCEASTDKYATGLKFTDAMGIDPYPGSFFPFETHVADVTAEAEKISSKYGKGIIQILEVFTFGNAAPTEVQLHSMMYQSVMAGADANGYFQWTMSSPQVDGATLDVSKWWPVITAFREKEYDIVWKHYGKHYDTQEFARVRTDDYWIDVWVDGTDMYAAVLNRKAEAQSISVPATSTNGLVKINDYEVVPVNGDAPVNKTVTGFDVDMPSGAALLFKITPSSEVDFGALNEFGDISGYSWAADAINTMYENGIVNDKGSCVFAPDKPVTRGDFAMFLINALGLESQMFGDSFDDVDANAEYAKAVAIGKKLGILRGTGDNMFNPELPITRQDLFVICARGLRITGKLESADKSVLGNFTDENLVAEYAAEDVAAMVYSGYLTGNADGTLNPLGNTSRAESAVIMSRLSNFK